MQWQAEADQAPDEERIRRLALLYAHAIDSRRPEIFDAIFTPDAVLDISGRLREGLPALHAMLDWAAENWLSTLHKVHNQLITVRGETAEAEVYCTAEHLERDRGGGTTLYSMSIRYADDLVRQDAAWRYRRRRLSIEWTDVRQVVWQRPR